MTAWLKFGRSRQGSGTSDLPLRDVQYAVLDTELTSLNHRKNRVLSIGAILMDGPRIRVGDSFYRIVDPGVDVPTAGVLIHKLRPSDVRAGSPPAQALDELHEFVGSRVLVGHFVNIDLKALRKELGDKRDKLKNPAIDTARVQRWIIQKGPPREDMIQQMETLDLASLAAIYGLTFREAHNALDDAFVTARLWQRMLRRLEEMGARTLRDLMKIGKV